MPFQPHMVCFAGDKALIWGFVISDFFIWLAYMMISAAVLFFATRRRVPSRGLWFGFFGFINLCGWSHILHALGVFHPNFYLAMYEEVVTAMVSMAVAVAVCSSIPHLLLLFKAAKKDQILCEEQYADIQQMQMLSAVLVDSTAARVESMKARHAIREARQNG